MSDTRFDPSHADGRWQRAWDAAGTFTADSDSPKPKSHILRRMFPYPSGRDPHGPCVPQTTTMGDVLARYPECAGSRLLAPDGLDPFGAGGKTRDKKGGHPARMDASEHRAVKAHCSASLCMGLDAPNSPNLPIPEYYGHEQALFSICSRGLRLPQGIDGQLGSGRHDGSGERSGDRRQGPPPAAPRSKAQANQWFLQYYRL